MNKSEQLAENIVNKKDWRGGVNLTEKGVKDLIEFCYNKGWNDAMEENQETPKQNNSEFESMFGNFFKNYTGKKY